MSSGSFSLVVGPVVGFIWVCWVYSGAPCGSFGRTLGVVVFIVVFIRARGDLRVHSESVGSFVRAMRFILVSFMRGWGSLGSFERALGSSGSFGFVGFIQAGLRVQLSAPLGWIHSGAPWEWPG